MQEQVGHTSIVLTADTYTSVLHQLNLKTAEATARLVLAAAARNPGQPTVIEPLRRKPPRPNPRADPNSDAASDPAGRTATAGRPAYAPPTPHKDRGRIAQ
ncbi:hypothetical protein [Phytohabitans kaempferiae]|uniref:Integrase n=1 Tax=Phytohabitans kaempferiae TaxID=1620943 RepID=A0ABV6M3F1_9ACTN